MVQPFHFDYDYFSKILAEDLLSMFSDLKQQRQGQSIYCYGLTSHAEFEMLMPFMLTEEALWEAVDKEINENPSRYKGMSRENLRWKLRHSYYVDHEYFDYFFIPSNLTNARRMRSKGMGRFDGMIVSARKELSEDEITIIMNDHHNKYRRACLDAFKEIDKKGCFGTGGERNKILVMFDLYGYADSPLQEFIEELNPPAVVDRYRIEKAKAESFDKIIRQNMGY